MLAPSTTSGDLPINLITSEWGQEISRFATKGDSLEMRQNGIEILSSRGLWLDLTSKLKIYLPP